MKHLCKIYLKLILSFLQNHSSKASTLQCSAFFIVQLSHPYMTIGKTRSEEHTSELQSPTHISYAVFCLGSKITADDDCSHEIKRRLLLGRKAMINLDSVFKSRDITLTTKVHLVKLWFFQSSFMDVRVGL